MRHDGRTTEVSWLPLRDSYEEAVLNWYEQIESSFRRRQLEAHRGRAEARTDRGVIVNTGQTASD